MDTFLNGWWHDNPAVTGPRLTTRILENRDDVTVLPVEAFYPYSWDEPEPVGEWPASSFAVHHWNHSWKHWDA
jgi:hypothetical protein